MAITRSSLVQEILHGTQKIDITPGYCYESTTMEAPKVFLVRGDYAYGYGPDGMIWMADVIDGACVHWSDAGPLYRHLEYMYGELFKLRLMDDDDLYVIMASHLHLVRELNRLILES